MLPIEGVRTLRGLLHRGADAGEDGGLSHDPGAHARAAGRSLVPVVPKIGVAMGQN